jgi:hypothetical protein
VAWSWAFHGRTRGSHIQKIRQTNTAETPLVILIKKHHETKKIEYCGYSCIRLSAVELDKLESELCPKNNMSYKIFLYDINTVNTNLVLN